MGTETLQRICPTVSVGSLLKQKNRPSHKMKQLWASLIPNQLGELYTTSLHKNRLKDDVVTK